MLQDFLLLAALFECTPCYAHYMGSTPIVIQYHVWEEQPSETRVGCLLDDLRQRGEMGSLKDFQFVQHGHPLPLTVAVMDGTVSTLGILDREELCWETQFCELAFNVLYRKSGAMHFLSVRVEIIDINDHSPVFPSPMQTVEISETAALKMRIPLDRALDPDAGPNGLQSYSLSSNQHFALDVHTSGGSKQAELIVIKELDRELQPSLELILTAWDKGNPPKSGSTKVKVTILDSNDNSPVFEDAPTVIELAEDTVHGTTVINLNAKDPDQGVNGEVEYSLSKHVPLDVHRLFSIQPKTGALILQGPLDFEEKKLYELDIQVQDLGPNAIPSHHKLQVKLRDVNDNAPWIHITLTPPDSPIATVLEGAPNETFIALVMVSDADSGPNGRVQVSITNGQSQFRLKQIHGDNYMVVTNDALDRERKMEYNLTFLAQDSGDPSLSCFKHLTVRVLDKNDNAPVFTKSLYRSKFKENNIPGFHFLSVEAHDVDLELNGKVSFSIRDTNELGASTAYFSVHPTNGAVTAQESLDFEESHSYLFIVEAVDAGYPAMTSSTTVLVVIQDVNDNYPIIHKPLPKKGKAVLSVPVNVDNGEIMTVIGDKACDDTFHKPRNHSSPNTLKGFLATTIQATDPDSGLNGRLNFRITDGNPSYTFFLDKATGDLYVNTTNATELSGKTFLLGIVVSDMGTPMLTTKTTLEINFFNFHRLKSVSREAQYSFTVLLAICSGTTCLLLVTVFLAKTFCHPHKRDNHAYNCRQAESTYTRHPRRPQKQIHKADIHLVPVLRGRKEYQTKDEAETLSSTADLFENSHPQGKFNLTPTLARMAQNQAYSQIDGNLSLSPNKILRKPRSIEWNGTLPFHPVTPYQTLLKTGNSSSSSFSNSQTITLKCHKNKQVSSITMDSSQTMTSVQATGYTKEATLRRPKTTEKIKRIDESDYRQNLRNLVRLSIAAFAENGSIKFSSASPEVQNHSTEVTDKVPKEESSNCQKSAVSLMHNTNNLCPPRCSPFYQYFQQNKSSWHGLEHFDEYHRQPRRVWILTSLFSFPFHLPTLYIQSTSSLTYLPSWQMKRDVRWLQRKGATMSLVHVLAAKAMYPVRKQHTEEKNQVSQLLSLLHQGQLQPRPNFRGNKYSHRTVRSDLPDFDWLSTKDSGHGESEIGDMDWETNRNSPVDPLNEEGLNDLLNTDDVISNVLDTAWMTRLSLPLTTDYHENLFVPDGLPSPEGQWPMASPNDSTSFSTFGRTPAKTILGSRALMSEVSCLFEMILTKKANAQSCSPADMLIRLSAANPDSKDN